MALRKRKQVYTVFGAQTAKNSNFALTLRCQIESQGIVICACNVLASSIYGLTPNGP